MRVAFCLVRIPLAALLTAASIATLSAGPVFAQSVEKLSFPIKAGYIGRFARYYAPYAIQAAAAYACDGGDYKKCVEDFQKVSEPLGPPEADADVNFAVSKVVSEPEMTSKARRLFRAWSYQFGTDGVNLACIDPADGECKSALPSFWRSWSSGSGPMFQVWGLSQYPHTPQDKCREFSIAFRGTLPGSLGAADWAFGNAALLSQAIGDDYYHQLRRNLNAIVRKIEEQPCYRRAGDAKPQLVSVGHSLGGGLAEFVALAHRRLTKAFSFDPSPITGAYLIDRKTLTQNSEGLTIDRIYQYGEALSYVRVLKQGYPPSGQRCAPRVRVVHVDADNGSPLDLHGINIIANHLVDLSYTDRRGGPEPNDYLAPDTKRNGNFELVSANDCAVRYRYAPPYDERNDTVAAATAGATAFANAQVSPGKLFVVQQPQVNARKAGRKVSPDNEADWRAYALVGADANAVHGSNFVDTSGGRSVGWRIFPSR